jgi:hypothetical protein
VICATRLLEGSVTLAQSAERLVADAGLKPSVVRAIAGIDEATGYQT